jgi:hypothetical protein
VFSLTLIGRALTDRKGASERFSARGGTSLHATFPRTVFDEVKMAYEVAVARKVAIVVIGDILCVRFAVARVIDER